jgi:hypothetical protein
VIPNSSLTVTSRRGVTALREWVLGGGTVVGFGEGCLAYTIEDDRSLRPTPGLAGLLPPGVIGKADAGDPIVADVGRGRAVLYHTPTTDGPYLHQAMGMLEAEARRAGVRQWCRADPEHAANLMYAGRDRISGRHLFVADFTRSVRNDPPEAEVDFWTDRAFDLWFDPSLSGEAELVGLANSFESCQGGRAEFELATQVLTVRFGLPGKLTLAFGKAGAP